MSGIFSETAWLKVWTYRKTFLLGLANTVQTAIFGVLLAMVLGIIFGLFATGGKKSLRIIARIYVEFIQNTPVLLQICFLYYALAFSGHSIGIIPAGIISLGVYHGAYMVEVIRAGIESIPKGQYEAAQVLGLSRSQTFFRVILPQVVKRILPPVTNEVITLVKDTSLAYAIAVTEMFTLAKQIAAAETSMLPYLAAGIFYYVFNFVVAWSMEKAEKAFGYYQT